MKQYKIVASDLDGTLLNNASQVSDENLQAIADLTAKGVYFVPCSGRTLGEMPAVVRENPAIDYVIHSNGAVVWNRQKGQIIKTCIPNALGREIMDILTASKTHITIRHNGQSLVDAACQTEKDYAYYNVIEAHVDCVRHYSVHLDNFLQYAYEADNVEVFSAFFHSYEEKLECRRLLEATGRVRVVEASEYNLEIVNIHAGKGNALYALADLLEIPREATMSLGDSDNDASITQAAGLGLATANACDSLKAIADGIICSNEEHVVPYILNHYFSKI